MAVAELELVSEAESARQETPDTNSYFSAEAGDRVLFAENFDHKPFEFRHNMQNHPAFQLSALLKAAERLSQDPAKAGKSHFESGNPDRNAWFGARPEGETLVHAVESI